MTGFRGGCRGSWSSLALRKPSASKHGSCRSRAIFVAPPVHHLSHSPSDWADDDFWSFVDRRTYRFALGVTARQGVYGRVRNTAFTVATPPAQALQVFLLPCLRFFSASAVDPGKRIGFLSDSNRGRVTPEMLELVGISVEPKRRRENSLSFPPPLMSDENAVSQGTGANAGEASTLHGKFSQVLPEPTATPLKLQVSEPVFQISPSHLSGPILIDRSSFCSLEEMGTGDRPGAPADFSGYIRSLLFSARTPRVTRDEAVESLGRRSVAHHPITFKRYKEGMTAAHYYPSRLLHPSKAAPLPKGVYVTPFTSVEKASSMGSISSKVLHRRAGKPLAATTDHEGHLHTPQTPVPLDERVMGRLTLLFIFTTHPPHSEVKDLSRWRQALEEQPDYISLVYQNSTADLQARQSCEHGALMQCLSVPDFPQHPPLRRRTGREFFQVAYMCSEPCSLLLRWLCLRSMRHTAAHFLSQLDRAFSGGGGSDSSPSTAPTLWGSFLGNAGDGGRKVVEAAGLRFRSDLVTTMLVDQAGLIRWHAVGAPTDEAVFFLVDAMKALRREIPGSLRSRPRLSF